MFTEPINKNDTWNPYFYKYFPGFSSILPVWKPLAAYFPYAWPQVEDYNQIAATKKSRVLFVNQHQQAEYEWEIFHHQRVMTREYHWHDFFNNLTWLSFPKLKWAIIKRVCQEFSQDSAKMRTGRQNLLAHFDECGMVICSDKPQILEDIKAFRWKKLFRQTSNLQQHCLPVIIGHGLLEKSLSPYIGMTAKAILLQVCADFFTHSNLWQLKYIDEKIAHFIQSENFPDSPQSLQPFPMLGWPTWHPENHTEKFFENTHYFREERKRKKQVALAELMGQ